MGGKTSFKPGIFYLHLIFKAFFHYLVDCKAVAADSRDEYKCACSFGKYLLCRITLLYTQYVVKCEITRKINSL
jgi:hypothetical protein